LTHNARISFCLEAPTLRAKSGRRVIAQLQEHILENESSPNFFKFCTDVKDDEKNVWYEFGRKMMTSRLVTTP